MAVCVWYYLFLHSHVVPTTTTQVYLLIWSEWGLRLQFTSWVGWQRIRYSLMVWSPKPSPTQSHKSMWITDLWSVMISQSIVQSLHWGLGFDKNCDGKNNYPIETVSYSLVWQTTFTFFGRMYCTTDHESNHPIQSFFLAISRQLSVHLLTFILSGEWVYKLNTCVSSKRVWKKREIMWLRSAGKYHVSTTHSLLHLPHSSGHPPTHQQHGSKHCCGVGRDLSAVCFCSLILSSKPNQSEGVTYPKPCKHALCTHRGTCTLCTHGLATTCTHRHTSRGTRAQEQVHRHTHIDTHWYTHTGNVSPM